MMNDTPNQIAEQSSPEIPNKLSSNNQTLDKTPTTEKPKLKIDKQSDLRIALSWLGSHVVALILCLIFSFSFISLASTTIIYVLIGTFSIVMYFGLMGGGAWKLGNDDLNKVKFNRRKEDLFRGFKIGMLTCVPMFLMAIALLLAKAELLPNFYIIYKILNGHMLAFINLIDGTFAGVLAAYLTEVPWSRLVFVCLLNFITPIICGINYFLGYKDLMMMDKLIYKKISKVKK